MNHSENVLRKAQNRVITRRQAMQGLAAIAAGAALPRSTEAVPLFKPMWLSNYTYVAPDLKKTADWYIEVFGMQRGQSDSKQVHLWYGDDGFDTLMIVRQASAGEQAPRIERFGFTIDDWDKAWVESQLKSRGLQPVSDTDKGFWVKDSEGNVIGVFARDHMRRPSAPATKPFLWKAISANHVVVTSHTYKELGAWYMDFLAFKQTTDNGRDVYQWFGDTVWIPTATRQGDKSSAELNTLDHVALTIENYKTEPVGAELKRRKMISADANVGDSLGINCVDINNFKTQVCAWNLVPNAERTRQQQGS
ncbi:MAG: VOC family protein [Acidobacteria bacterium]|nr:VOC family protein [Acidobacteriota bacterium]